MDLPNGVKPHTFKKDENLYFLTYIWSQEFLIVEVMERMIVLVGFVWETDSIVF